MRRKDIAIADNKPRSLGRCNTRDFPKCRAGHRDLMSKGRCGELDGQKQIIGPNCRCPSLVVRMELLRGHVAWPLRAPLLETTQKSPAEIVQSLLARSANIDACCSVPAIKVEPAIEVDSKSTNIM